MRSRFENATMSKQGEGKRRIEGYDTGAVDAMMIDRRGSGCCTSARGVLGSEGQWRCGIEGEGVDYGDDVQQRSPQRSPLRRPVSFPFSGSTCLLYTEQRKMAILDGLHPDSKMVSCAFLTWKAMYLPMVSAIHWKQVDGSLIWSPAFTCPWSSGPSRSRERDLFAGESSHVI